MLKEIKWNAIFSSLAMLVAGILLIVLPDISSKIICTVIGIIALVIGLSYIISYFMLETRLMLYRNDLVTGILIAMLGLLALFKQDFIANLIPLILGLVIVISGLAKLQNAAVAKKIGYEGAGAYMILSIISIVVGLLIMFFLSGTVAMRTLFTIIGIGLLYSGASDLYVTVFLSGKYHKFKKAFEEKNNVIEAETSNERESE